MTHVYEASGTVYRRNEFMKDTSKYETNWTFQRERYMAETLEEAMGKVMAAQGVCNDKFMLVEVRDLHITDLGEISTEGVISLQTGKSYNCTTLISVPARNIRSAEGEGFVPMRGAMRCEVMYEGEEWHAKKFDLSSEWRLDCRVGEEPEVRKRGRIALEADQTPDLASFM